MRKYAGIAAVGLFLVVVGWQFLKHKTYLADFSSTDSRANDLYSRDVQPVFDNRCIVCHSCNNAPCQLNLTSYQGLQRGASKILLYEGERPRAIAPTRLDIDASNEAGWKARGFFRVVDPDYSSRSPFLLSLSQKIKRTSEPNHSAEEDLQKLLPVSDSHVCPTREESPDFYSLNPHMGMPYGLPPLTSDEMAKIKNWIAQGAPAQVPTFSVTPEELSALKEWEAFLNFPRSESKLVARYLYEHLFLAHVHFSANPKQFFRLVRSRTACAEGVDEIPTRRPNDDPGQTFDYCFKPLQQTIVEKTHLPYLMDQKKLDWVKKNFFAEDWQVAIMPDYHPFRSANPFKTFESIPVEARYRFLLEDAHYHVSTFIKGPVCNGNIAVNAIDDHFFVFFYDPKADLSVKDPDFHRQSQDLLSLPAEQGSDAPRLGLATYFSTYPTLRNQYRKVRSEAMKKNFPEGLSLSHIWNGENSNDNAVLTVFRHGDHSSVLKGPRGDASHSAFVLDYSLFERLAYNLAVGFDVYGNITHQLHTRVYMGMIRMEAENNFLEFLPRTGRSLIRNEWYASKFFGKIEKKLFDKKIPDETPTRVAIPENLSPDQMRTAIYDRILNEQLRYMVDRYPDPINRRKLRIGLTAPDNSEAVVSEELERLVSRTPEQGAPWVHHFPDTSLLVLKKQNAVTRIYTIIRNKKVKELGSILFEDLMRKPNEDELMILKGVATSYPNYFFVVQEYELPKFIDVILADGGHPEALSRVKLRWGLERSRPDFWTESDKIQNYIKSTMGINGGVIDYTRYDVWAK